MAGIYTISSPRGVIEGYRREPGFRSDQFAIRGGTVNALDLEPAHLETLIEELELIVRHQSNPGVAEMICQNSHRIYDIVRAVNRETKQGYVGAAARGEQLVLNPLRQGDVSITHGWDVAVAVIGAATWIGSSGTNIQMLVSSLPVIGHIYLGFVCPVGRPKLSTVQVVKDGDAYAEEVVDFDWREGFGEQVTPTYALKQPWLFTPSSTYYIPVRYDRTGWDYTQPVAFTVKRARDIIAALA